MNWSVCEVRKLGVGMRDRGPRSQEKRGGSVMGDWVVVAVPVVEWLSLAVESSWACMS